MGLQCNQLQKCEVRNASATPTWEMTTRGVASKFDWVGVGVGGGRIQVSKYNIHPNSDFSSDFSHLFVNKVNKIGIGKPKIFGDIHKKKFFKIAISGGHPPKIRTGGTCHPHPPPRWRRPWKWPVLAKDGPLSALEGDLLT